jgi:hypothetical protein
MNDDKKTLKSIKVMGAIDVAVSIFAIFLGIYLYIVSGEITSGSLFFSPIALILGGLAALALTLINIPQRLMSRMRNKMVVKK